VKNLYIAEKPSVAREFAKALGMKGAATAGARDGYLENEDTVVTWCVGHLITMSYPEVYDPALKKWSFDTIPFIPEEYKYEIIDASSKQFQIVSRLLNREDVGRIYVCTDSGREGEYIYRLVEQMAGVDKSKKDRRRVWIDSQTEEEIMRGIREAKELSAYDNLSDAAYLRAQEDYLMGINFSRALSLKYSYTVRNYLGMDRCVIAVGRVMTCVLGMIVKREREIRQFVPTPFYRVLASTEGFEAEWKTTKDSAYLDSPLLYKENGFKKEESAKQLITELSADAPIELIVQKVEKKTEKKAPPMLYNLAELQNDCSRLFKISPTDTLNTVQTLYERKLVTYPRTDARVLSTAVAKEIGKNIGGLQKYEPLAQYAQYIMQQGGYKGVAKSKYVNDKQITDHYAIIPTGQGLGNLNGLNDIQRKVYDIIARRFLSIFFPAAEYEKVSLVLSRQIHTVVGEKENGTESFFANFKRLKNPGYLTIAGLSSDKKQEEQKLTDEELAKFASLKKGDAIPVQTFNIKEGETSPPKRYSSGTLILAMENAGQLIEDEELRSQIKGSGIGTSATRDSIITKLVTNKYIALNKKTQIVTPTFLGEIIYDVCLNSIQSLLWAEMTASWEKGLSGVAEGTISKDEYTAKMNKFVCDNTNAVKQIRNQNQITRLFDRTKPFYEKAGAKKAAKKS
jgi:DNA topoisomerase-3